MKISFLYLLLLSITFVACSVEGENSHISQQHNLVRNDSTKLFKQRAKRLEKFKNRNLAELTQNKEVWILISKSEYTLAIMHQEDTLKLYPAVFGFNPKDDKRREGDGCTPEGEFKVISAYKHRKWNKFIFYNYPTSDSWQKHKQAKREGKIDKNATVGSELGIHGVPKGYDYMIDTCKNWTLGCTSVKNKDINEFYPYIKENTKIKIVK